MNPVYKGLKNVKFLINKDLYREAEYMNIFGEMVTGRERIPENEYTYYAIYNYLHNKYIVTNDIMSHGLNGTADYLEIVGSSDSLDYIIFHIWEHQKELGEDDTILEHIKVAKKVLNPSTPNDSEWDEDNNHNKNNTPSRLVANINVDFNSLISKYGTRKYTSAADFLFDHGNEKIELDLDGEDKENQ